MLPNHCVKYNIGTKRAPAIEVDKNRIEAPLIESLVTVVTIAISAVLQAHQIAEHFNIQGRMVPRD